MQRARILRTRRSVVLRALVGTAIAGASALIAVAAGPAAEGSSAVVSSHAATNALPSVYDGARYLVRPTGRTVIDYSGTGSWIVGQFRWKTWTDAEATGTTTVYVNRCKPTCAAGNFTATRDVAIKLLEPVPCAGRQVFSWLTLGRRTAAPSSGELPLPPGCTAAPAPTVAVPSPATRLRPSPAVVAALRVAFAKARHVRVSELSRTASPLLYARYEGGWYAVAGFAAARGAAASEALQFALQDGPDVFVRSASTPWLDVSDTGGVFCPPTIPASVLHAWHISTVNCNP